MASTTSCRTILLLFLAAALTLVPVGRVPGRAARSPVGTPPAALCGNGHHTLAGVYQPSRLEVVVPCAYVTGTVEYSALEPDGDDHVRLHLDARFRRAINAQNRRMTNGNLVVEIIPLDQKDLSTPRIGEHVLVVGPYVLDRDHGWMEIHPVRYWIPLRDWSTECQPPSGPAAAARRC